MKYRELDAPSHSCRVWFSLELGWMVPIFILFVGNPSFRFVPGPDDATLVDVLPFMIATPFLLIGFLAVVCVVIYQIFKYRLEKDEDLFL